MRVSIITVCFNSEATIEATIQSVLKQDFPDIEYIIIDGGSVDKTPEIISRYRDKIAKVVSEKDRGMYDAINKGIALAKGDIIGLLHSDDFYPHPGVITEVVREFESSGADCVYGDLQYVLREDTSQVVRQWKSKPYKHGLFLKGWMPPHPTFFVKRQYYSSYGNFNISFSISADYELMLRFMHKHQITSSYIPKVLVKMRTGGISNVTFSSRLKANREDRLAWKINGLKAGSLTLLLKPLSKLRQFINM